jgi:hypothetical protein
MNRVILILIVLISFTSCDLFTTRVAEPPDQTRSNFTPPIEVKDVIKNLENSLADKNVQNYIACFVDTLFAQKSFSFSASSEALSLYQIFLQGWGLNEEKRYFTSIANRVSSDIPILLSFSDENITNLSDSSIYSATYTINVPLQVGDPFPQNYSGSLQFNMLRDSRGEYVIYYWKDIKSGSLPSWSELKGSSY